MTNDERNLEQIRRDLVARRRDLAARRERVGNDLARRNEPLVGDSADQAIQKQNDETLQALGDAAAAEIAAIDDALARLDRGLYGVCRKCGEPIEPGRLRAIPYAVMCAGCSAG